MENILPPQETAEGTSGIKDLIILLNAEIIAIKNGELDRVLSLYDKKTLLLERLETASSKIESRLLTKTDAANDLRNDLKELHELIQKDAQLLANITEATKEIITEIARIRGRHNLDGLYSSAGEKHPEVVSFEQQIDQSV